MGNDVQLTDNSSISSGSIDQYNWDLGDGNTGTGTSVSHSYANAGDYNVQLIVTSDAGCSDTAMQNASVHPLPAVDFTSDSTCTGNTIQLTDHSTISNGSIDQYDWSLGDGTNANGSSVNHTYANPDNYEIKLVATSDQTCMDSTTRNAKVHPLPVAGFTSDSACFGNEINLVDNSTISSGSIDAYDWEQGNGDTQSGTSLDYTYPNAGNYDVNLIVISDFGCKDTAKNPVMVQSIPQTAFSAPDTCERATVQFTNETTFGGNAGNLNYDWSLGDGTISGAENPSHMYNNNGTYNVSLIVSTNTLGCVDTSESTIEIHPNKSASFNADLGPGRQATFTPDDTTAAEYEWEFGDGTSSDAVIPTHTYSENGIYEVTLTTTTAFGCQQRNIQSVNIETVSMDEIKGLAAFELYPNPVEQDKEVVISYSLKQPANVQLAVYNAIGKRIETINESKQNAGLHEYEFSTKGQGKSGIYFIRLQVDREMQVKRLMQLE